MSKKTRAFSLIEMIIVVAIIATLSTVVVSNFTGGTRDARIDGVASDIVSFLRKARQNSVAILEHPSSPGVYPSYGVHLSTKASENDTITLYADCKPDDTGDDMIRLDDSFHLETSNCSGKGKVEEMELKYGIKVTDISFEGVDPSDPTALTMLDVLYIRPEPTVWYAAKAGGGVINLDAGTARVTITSPGTGDTRDIVINSIGLLYVE